MPDYNAVSKKKGKWVIQVQGDGYDNLNKINRDHYNLSLCSFRLPDWTELYPLHKFACAGDAEGVMRCIRLGISPDERDSDTWSPLHYACW